MRTGRLLNSVAALVLMSLSLIPGLRGRQRLNLSSPRLWLYSGGIVLSAALWTVAAMLTP